MSFTKTERKTVEGQLVEVVASSEGEEFQLPREIAIAVLEKTDNFGRFTTEIYKDGIIIELIYGDLEKFRNSAPIDLIEIQFPEYIALGRPDLINSTQIIQTTYTNLD